MSMHGTCPECGGGLELLYIGIYLCDTCDYRLEE